MFDWVFTVTPDDLAKIDTKVCNHQGQFTILQQNPLDCTTTALLCTRTYTSSGNISA
jgi:hypothetical protein